MLPTPNLARPALAGTTALLAAVAATPAGAASPCGAAYVIEPGDTLYQVAQSCRVPLEALMEANPDLGSVDAVQIGTRLVMPGGEGRGAPAEGAQGDPRIHLRPVAGAPGTPIAVTGQDYRPGSTVTIGSGPPESEWEALDEATVRPSGRLEALVNIPDDAEPGREIVFVIETEKGETIVSRRVDVVAARDPDAGEGPPAGEPGPGSDRVSLEGRVDRGAECYTLTTPEGEVYSLTGQDGFEKGDYVRVEGETADMSFCMQGEATVTVETISEIPPPARDRDPGRSGGLPVTRDYVLGPWTAKGAGCDRPDFDVTGNAAGGQVVETRLNGDPRTGYVRVGDEPALIFDQPRRELPLETRGPDALSVLPPDGEREVMLGDEIIEGDGRVFIKCAVG